MLNANVNGQVVEPVKGTKNQLGQVKMFKVCEFIKGLGEAEIATMRRAQIAEIVSKNFDFPITEMNIKGALKIIGFKTQRTASALQGRQTRLDGLSDTPHRVSQCFRYLKNEVSALREDQKQLGALLHDLRDQVRELVKALK